MRELLMEEIEDISGGADNGEVIGIIGSVVTGVAASEFAAGFVIGAGWGSALGPIGMIGVGVFAGLVGWGMANMWENC